MELHEFAQRILFATTLEEKLQCPALITDQKPGPPLDAPVMPGRPVELQFKPQGVGKGEFPGVHRIENERDRGRLLHFFANHELLATELMALVLLRFPEAPASFRRGVLQTLKDEQEHTRIYIQRMHECGIEFGELPVSGYFWRAISGMESPIDYVAGLSLTFEQANLDFARQYSRAFAAAGDEASARLLEKIYRDEIAHVAYGLKWFRRWKNPTESDWAAFCRQLRFPLSPQRAKGFALNVEGRRAAGFGGDFIDELSVYSQSRGRTPAVFLFNPFAEGFIAQGKSFTPVKAQAQLARDLENLPQFLCREDDVVLVEQKPSLHFLSALKQAGFDLPEFVMLRNGHIDAASSIHGRKVAELRPWAWGPDAVEILQPLFESLTRVPRLPAACFNATIAQLYSKLWSADLLRRLLEATSDHKEILSPCEVVGTSIVSLDAALDQIALLRQQGHQRLVAKQAFGLAGSNAIRLWEPQLLEPQRRWIERALQIGPLVLEPWLERLVDFSAQFEMTADGLKCMGYCGLMSDHKGQFQGNWAAPGFDRRIPFEVTSLFPGQPEISHRLRQVYGHLCRLLEEELREHAFLGPLGIDAFVYRDSTGNCRVKPIVEINPRYTMGRLTLELMKRVAPGSHGRLRLINLSTARAEGADTLADYAGARLKQFPLQLEGEPVAKIREGIVCLNDPAQAQVCLALFQVSRSPVPARPGTHRSTAQGNALPPD